jgi:hypothetical protein
MPIRKTFQPTRLPPEKQVATTVEVVRSVTSER